MSESIKSALSDLDKQRAWFTPTETMLKQSRPLLSYREFIAKKYDSCPDSSDVSKKSLRELIEKIDKEIKIIIGL